MATIFPIYDQNGNPYFFSADKTITLKSFKGSACGSLTGTLFIKDFRTFLCSINQVPEKTTPNPVQDPELAALVDDLSSTVHGLYPYTVEEIRTKIAKIATSIGLQITNPNTTEKAGK